MTDDEHDEEDVEAVWPDGLVAVGGSLHPDVLLSAYRQGIFPWSSDPALNWWSPDPRAIFDLETWKPPRRLLQRIRSRGWRFAVDTDFAGVMRGCAEPAPGRAETWITHDFLHAYAELHRRGHAHSLEVYEGDALVGGIYGVTIGSFFGGESMFHRRTDASKAAVLGLVDHLRARGYRLFDAQVPNPHLMSLGAKEIPRREFLGRLKRALKVQASFAG